MNNFMTDLKVKWSNTPYDVLLNKNAKIMDRGAQRCGRDFPILATDSNTLAE